MNIVNTVKAIIGNGSTFASIEYTTNVKTSAKFNDVSILKSSKANVTLFGTLKDYAVYKRAVIKSANSIDGQSITDFNVSDTYFKHTNDCFSIVEHKATNQLYLYAMFNRVTQTAFTVNGKPATREQVALYLTPSAAKLLLGDNSVVYNKLNDTLHTTIIRTIKLENITHINSNSMALNIAKTALHA